MASVTSLIREKKGFRFLHEMSIIKKTLPPTGKRISCYRYRYKECGKAFSSAVEISCLIQQGHIPPSENRDCGKLNLR